MTSPYLWLLCLTSVIPSVLWWHSTAILSWFLLAFVIAYVWLYARIVRFKTPRWMVFGPSPPTPTNTSSRRRSAVALDWLRALCEGGRLRAHVVAEAGIGRAGETTRSQEPMLSRGRLRACGRRPRSVPAFARTWTRVVC